MKAHLTIALRPGRVVPTAALVGLFCAALSSSGPLVAPAGASALERAERVVLDNGLTVLLLPEPGSGLVSVGVMYRVGAKHEAAGTTGLAHYAEHMCFRATRRFPGHEITESVTRRGGRWSGYTWIDQTFYQATLSKDDLSLALDLEADRMGEALYDEEAFAQERTSVIAELRSYDEPHALLYDETLLAAFQIHPYRNNTIGFLSDVEAVSRKEAYRFYLRYYHPRNAVLAIGGDFDRGQALQAVHARFAAKAAGDHDTHVATVEPPQSGQRRLVVRKPGPHAEVLLAFRAPALAEPDFPAMVLFDALLAGGKGLRFLTEYEAPVDTPLRRSVVASGAAGDAQSAFQASLHPYVYTLKATTADASELASAEEALFAAVEAAAVREWTEVDLRRARRQVQAGLARDLDTLAGRVHQLAFFEVSGGFEQLQGALARLEAVSAETARLFARERLTREKATVGWFVPTPGVPVFTGGQAPRPALPSSAAGPTGTTVGPAPSSTATPAPTQRPDRPATLASPIARFRLANGLALTVSPRSATGLLALRGRIDAGAVHEKKAGTSVLAAHLFAQAAREPGAPPLVLGLREDPSRAAHSRFLEFEATALPEDLPALARSVARGFRLDPASFGLARQAALEAAAEAEADTARVLTATACAAFFGATSPLGRKPWGEAAALSGLSEADVGAFAKAFLLPARAALSVAGPVEPDAVRRVVEAAFAGALPPGGGRAAARRDDHPRYSALPPLDAARGPAAWTVTTLERKDASQNTLHVALVGDRSRAHDRAATAVLLYLLGETYYSGRLGRALVEPGLVYSVWTTLEGAPDLPGYLLVRTAASKENTAEVLRRVRAVLEESARGAFTSAELAEAKAYLRGKAARRGDGALNAAAAVFDDTPSGPSPQALTLEQLNDTARRLLARGAPLALVGGPGE